MYAEGNIQTHEDNRGCMFNTLIVDFLGVFLFSILSF